MTNILHELCIELKKALEYEYGDPPIDRLALLRRADTILQKYESDKDCNSEQLDKAFERWWYDEGSATPQLGDDYKTHTKKMSRIAWHNGAYITKYRCPPPSGYVSTNIVEQSGKTTKIMKAASRDAIFVWYSCDRSYPVNLAKKIGREDLNIVPLDRFLKPSGPIDLFSAFATEVVIDHHARDIALRGDNFGHLVRAMEAFSLRGFTITI